MISARIRLIATEHRSILTLVAVLAIACLALWFYLLVPRQHRLTALQADWAAKRRQLMQSEGARPTDRAAIDRLWASLPQRHDLPRILGQLYDLAGLSHAAVTVLDYKPGSNGIDGLTTYNLHCSVSGRYPALKRFLFELHRLPGLATITGISITADGPLQEQAVLDTQLEVHLRSGATP